MIRNLVFDFGKVLVDYDFERVIRDFFHQGDHLEEYCRIVLSDAFMNRCDLGVEPLEKRFCARNRRRTPIWHPSCSCSMTALTSSSWERWMVCARF